MTSWGIFWVVFCNMSWPWCLPTDILGYIRDPVRLQKETGKDQTLSKKEGKHIEILILYSCPKKPLSAGEPTLGIPSQSKKMGSWILPYAWLMRLFRGTVEWWNSRWMKKWGRRLSRWDFRQSGERWSIISQQLNWVQRYISLRILSRNFHHLRIWKKRINSPKVDLNIMFQGIKMDSWGQKAVKTTFPAPLFNFWILESSNPLLTFR